MFRLPGFLPPARRILAAAQSKEVKLLKITPIIIDLIWLLRHIADCLEQLFHLQDTDALGFSFNPRVF